VTFSGEDVAGTQPGSTHVRGSLSWCVVLVKKRCMGFRVDGRRERQARAESKVIAHADEFETSLYLHLAPERVQMDLASADDDVMGAYLSSDSTSPYVRFNDYWSRWTDLGVHGDARPATAEKGEIIFETAVSRLVELAEEWRNWPLAERRDFHERPAQTGIRW
jgi:creatinine amidohydrolase